MQLQNFINSIDYSTAGRWVFSTFLLLFSSGFVQLTKFAHLLIFLMCSIVNECAKHYLLIFSKLIKCVQAFISDTDLLFCNFAWCWTNLELQLKRAASKSTRQQASWYPILCIFKNKSLQCSSCSSISTIHTDISFLPQTGIFLWCWSEENFNTFPQLNWG